MDTWVFPILFLYRQYLELQMKDMVLNYGNMNTAEKKKFLKDSSHSLKKVWNKLKPILLDSGLNDKEIKDVEIVEGYIEQFHQRDLDSIKFRYPIGKELNRVVDREYRINLKNLRDRMKELENFFNGVDGALSERERG